MRDNEEFYQTVLEVSSFDNRKKISLLLDVINWQPYLKGLIQEICEYDWFKLLASGICTERYQYRIRNYHNGSNVTCSHEFRCNAVH